MADNKLADWHSRAVRFQEQIKKVVIGMDRPVQLITACIFARGHVMLEGDVGVGKTTLLKAVARGIGGAYERIEGTIDLMPNDLVYHTYINEQGKPQVDPGPILKHGDALSTFFFNEVNRARPQVHSLLLRVMAEKSVSAFNREFHFPYLQVFADRNRVEKDETFEIPSAARDRFMLEIRIETPKQTELKKELMFDPRFFDVERLIKSIPADILPYREINPVSELIQRQIQSSDTLKQYALDLWLATREPQSFGVEIPDVDMDRLLLAGASARGAGMLMRIARVHAWLNQRGHVIPEDLHEVFHEAIAHRIFFNPTYELRRIQLAQQLTSNILQQVAAP